MSSYRCIAWKDGIVRMIDQRILPQETKYLDFTDASGVAFAIRNMVIRGAPAIGVAAAYGMALAAYHSQAQDVTGLRAELEEADCLLRASRPTAVNLFYALDLMRQAAGNQQFKTVEDLRRALLAEARAIDEENTRICRDLSLNGQAVVPQNATFIHHCNTGALATVDYGTALGVIGIAHEQGKNIMVYVDETRPRLQGGRLTTWELKALGVPHKLIADGASGMVMRTRHVDLAVVGCDRVAANGDTANKLGTYNLALVAREHGVPFYIAAPTSTIDLNTPTGDQIEIEERSATEVTHIGSEQITPDGTQVFNPAFDVTPAKYITAFITEEGLAYPPFKDSLAHMMHKANERRRSVS